MVLYHLIGQAEICDIFLVYLRRENKMWTTFTENLFKAGHDIRTGRGYRHGIEVRPAIQSGSVELHCFFLRHY